MDFQKLMKQAALNQTSKIQKFEQLKEKEKKEQAVVEVKKVKEQRKANDRLQKYETDLVKSKLTYNGLLSRKGEPLTDKAKRQLDEIASRTKTPPTATPTSTSKKTTLSVHKTSKSKSTSPNPTTSLSKTKGGTTSSKSISSTKVVTKSKTPPPRLKKPSAGPVNYKDLMKIAKKNNTQSSSVSSLLPVDKKEEEKIKEPGIGKALLLNKHKKEDKPIAGKSLIDKKASVDSIKTATVKGTSSINGKDNPNETSHSKTPSQKKDYPYGPPPKKDYPYGPPPKKDYPYGPPPSLQNKESQKKDYPYGPPPNRTKGNPVIESKSSTERGGEGGQKRINNNSKIIKTGQGTSTSSSSSNNKIKSKSFYGSRPLPSSARLIKDGPSSRTSQSSLLHYKSAWVDEMRDYLQTNNLDLDEDEDDEEEMDDFVVDEEEGEQDYSSAIQEIFGSRYKTRLADEDDDRLMESSYTQQQFEEYRSARIGEMEDAEDIKREQEMLRRKRNKSAPANKVTKKIKY